MLSSAIPTPPLRELTAAEIELVAGGFAQRGAGDDDVIGSKSGASTTKNSDGSTTYAYVLGTDNQISGVTHDENGTEVDYKDGSAVFVSNAGNTTYVDSKGDSVVVTPTGSVFYDHDGNEMGRLGQPNIPETLTVPEGSGTFSFDLTANHIVTGMETAADGTTTLHYRDGSSASVDNNGAQTYKDPSGNSIVMKGDDHVDYYDSDGNLVMGDSLPENLGVGLADISTSHSLWIPNVAPQSTMHDADGNTILVYVNPDQSINYFNLGTGIETDVFSNGQAQFYNHDGQLYAATQGPTTTWYDADGNPTGSTIANPDGSQTVLDGQGHTEGTIYANGAATWTLEDGTVMNQSTDGQLHITETIEVSATGMPLVATEPADLNLSLNLTPPTGDDNVEPVLVASNDDAWSYGGGSGGGGDNWGDGVYREDFDVA